MPLIQTDYLAEVSRPARRVAIAALLVVTLVGVAALALVIAAAIIIPAPPSLVWACIAIFAFLSAASGWMLIRLLGDAKARNAVTNMPEWFIQGFGLLLLVGLCALAIVEAEFLLALEGLGVCGTMLGIGRLLRQKRDQAASSAATARPSDA